MHMYVSRLKDTEPETLIATYDIPLHLRPRLPYPNFRMINLSVEDTAIGIYSRIFDSSGVRIPFSSFLLAVLKYFKVHISQLVPLDTLQTGGLVLFAKRGDPTPVYKIPTDFNQNHVDQLKAHIVKLRDIPEGVLVRSGISRVWHNPMCDLVLRCSDNTVMGIYDFLCMPSLDKATVREEPHRLDTSILGRVADRTTSPAPAGTPIPRASPEEITVTRPDHKVVTKANHVAKQKASTRPEISTNTAKKIKSSKKVSGAGSSRLVVGDKVEQIDDGTLDDDDDQRDGSEFAMEDIGNLNDVSQGGLPESVFTRLMVSLSLHLLLLPVTLGLCLICFSFLYFLYARVSEDVSSPAQEAVPASDTQPIDVDAGADEIASDGNVDPYYEARVSNTVEDVLKRNLLPFVSGPYYIPYPYDEGSRKLYKDPKACRTALDQFPTPAETHRLRELSSVDLSDRMSVLQCQLITRGSALNARYDHSLRNVKLLMKRCAQQTQTIKKQSADLRQTTESTVRVNEEVSRKYRNERDVVTKEKAKIKEELVETKSQLKHHGRQAEEIQASISSFFHVGVKSRLHMDHTDEEFRELSQSVAGFIPDANKKFDRPLQDIARLKPGRVAPSHQTSSAAVSSRSNTYLQYSTSSSGTFGRTSTPQHLKKNYSSESNYYALKGEVFVPLPSAAESVSKGCSA
ncbi:hypothetical protein Tco_0596512 [Tanacetum coccineum]